MQLAEVLLTSPDRPGIIYTSGLKRAQETARIAAGQLQIPCLIHPGLEELSFGLWEGLTWEQVDFERSQIQLSSRTVPVDGTLMDCLHAAHRRWAAVIGDPANNCVVWSDRYHKQMQPQAISRIARRALDEEGQTEVRLVDLRHDYVIRQLERHDWSYVARITGTEIRSLQLHFTRYLPGGAAGSRQRQENEGIDEFRLWKILQTEKDTPAGLALWLTWHMGLTSNAIVSLTWD